MGRGVSCVSERRRYGEVAAGERGPGAREHHLHPGLAGMCVPHHGLQFAGRQNPRRAARPTRYVGCRALLIITVQFRIVDCRMNNYGPH